VQEVYLNQGLFVLKDIFSNLQIKKVFFIIGKNSYSHAESLIDPYIKGIDVNFFTVPDSNFEAVIYGTRRLKQYSPDIVIAIGGGRVIDAAKLISTAVISIQNYEDIVKGKEKINEKIFPLLVMPTTAGTGSEATCFSVVYLQEKKYSIISKLLLPDIVIADSSLVQKMPDYLRSCSIFDAFSQAIESFWSIGADSSNRENSEKSITLINRHLQDYLNNDKETIKYMVEAAYLSGKAINESKTTLPHALSYFITSKYKIPHGHAVALTLGFVGKINASEGSKQLKKVMNNISDLLNIDLKNFDAHWYKLMKISGLEVNLSKLGIRKNDIELIVDSVNVERLKNHPLNISRNLLIDELNKML